MDAAYPTGRLTARDAARALPNTADSLPWAQSTEPDHTGSTFKNPPRQYERGDTLISADRARTLFTYAADTGLVHWLTTRFAGRLAGCRFPAKHGGAYMRVQADGRCYMLHRVIWLMVTGEWPRGVIDHINCDGMDNRWANLRDVDAIANIQNQRYAQRTNKLGALGVDVSDGKYRAQICVEGKKINLGRFDTEAEARAAYLGAKRATHRGNTL